MLYRAAIAMIIKYIIIIVVFIFTLFLARYELNSGRTPHSLTNGLRSIAHRTGMHAARLMTTPSSAPLRPRAPPLARSPRRSGAYVTDPSSATRSKDKDR